MSSDLKGGLTLTGDSTRFVESTRAAIRSLTNLDTSTNKSVQTNRQLAQAAQSIAGPLGNFSQQTLRAGQSLTNTTQQIQRATTQTQTYTRAAESAAASTSKMAIQMNQAKSAVSGLSASSGQAAANMQRVGQSTQQATAQTSRFNANTVGTAASIGTMGAGLVSLEASMSNYAKATYKVEKAELGVQKSRDGLQKSQTMLLNAENMLEKARKAGNKTAQEMQYYEEQVINYRQDVATKTEDLTLKQERLNIVNMDYADTQKLMASSIATTLLGTISAAAQMISAKSIATAKDTAATKGNTLANIANSRALKFLGIDLTKARTHFSTASTSIKGMTLSSKGLQLGLKGVAAGVKGLYASIGPLGWAIIGITTIWQAWEENLFGFRDGVHWVIDELQKLWGLLKSFLPVLGMIETAFSSLGFELGKSVDEWQAADQAIYQTDETMQHVDTTMSGVTTTTTDLTDAAAMLTSTEQGLETQTDETTGAMTDFDDAITDATTSTLAHTTAISADMMMMRQHSQAVRENSASMLDDHIVSFDGAADAILTHDERLRVNLAGLQNWAKNYKDKMSEGAEYASQFVQSTEIEFENLVSSLKQDGHDVDATLKLMGITTVDTSSIISQSMSSAGQSMHGFASDTESAGARVHSTMKTLHNEIAAFEAALKKNDNFVEWTISDILRGFQVMSKQAQAEYEKIMILKAKAIAGGHTSIDSLEDALTVTEQARTGNWNNPTHDQGVGANMQHHGPTQVDQEANKLLREGIYVPAEYLTGGMWKKSHSDSYKLGKKYHSKTGKPKAVATWNGREFVIHKPGSPEYVKLFGVSGFSTVYTSGGPSSRKVALETSLGYDIDEINQQVENRNKPEQESTDAETQDDTREILEMHVK